MASPGEGDEQEWRKDRKKVRQMDAIERDQFYYERGLERIKENPQGFLRTMGRRFLQMWYKTDSGRYENFLLLKNGSLLVLAVIGIIISRRKWRDLLLFLAVIFYYIGLHMVLVALVRYILPIIPIITVLAMVPINELFNRVAALAKLWPKPQRPLVETKV
jgi:hypothetical protein